MPQKETKNSSVDFLKAPVISEREKYKNYIQNNESVLKLKEKVREVVTAKGLGSVMNDTKWLKLQKAIEQLPFPPPYIDKLVLEDRTFEEVQINYIPRWVGDWSPFYTEGMSLFFTIEYIKVKPLYGEFRGQLIAPKIFDETIAFEQLLKDNNIPYEEDNGTFTIFGYK